MLCAHELEVLRACLSGQPALGQPVASFTKRLQQTRFRLRGLSPAQRPVANPTAC